MKKEEVSAVIDRIDEQYIREASAFAADDQASSGAPAGPEKIRRRRLRVRVLAACAALVVLAGSATAAFAVEEKEYKTAVAFFAENELSTEGLSRADVKAVYRDIVTQRFALDKTEEVLRQTVTGVEILQRKLLPGELALLWREYREKRRMNPSSPTLPKKGISYQTINNELYRFDKSLEECEKPILLCYLDGELIWEIEFNTTIAGKVHTADGTAVWGHNIRAAGWKYTQPEAGWLARVDEEGNCVWDCYLDHGFEYENIYAIVDNGDGTWAVFSTGDRHYLCMSRFSVDGHEIGFRTTEAGKSIQKAIRAGENYFVSVVNYESNYQSRIIKLDRDGKKIDEFSFDEEDWEYAIADMVEFGGQVYFSAYVYPKPHTEATLSSVQRQFYYVWQYAIEEWDRVRDSKEFIPSSDDSPETDGIKILYVFPSNVLGVVRDKQTAVLLVCDPTDGTPKTFFEVEESLSGKLAINDDGQLEWEVYKIVEASCSIDSNSYSFIVRAKVYQYVFDTDGNLIGRIDTGKLSVLHV